MMKTLLPFLLLFALGDKTWHCTACKKDVPASEVQKRLCRDPHDILHAKDCTAMRHTCLGEVTPVLGTPIKPEAAKVQSDKQAFFLATDAEAGLKGSTDLKAGDPAFAHVYLGMSGNGADPLRAARARADYDAKSRTVRVIVTRVSWTNPPQVGTADVCWVGWSFPIGKLDAGEVKLVVFEEREVAPKPGAKPTETSTPAFQLEKVFKVK